MAVLSMSRQEFSRLEVLLRIQSGRLPVEDACTPIGQHRRPVFRLLRNLKQDGATPFVEAPQQPEQSSASGRRPQPCAVDHPPSVCGLWPSIRGRKVSGAALMAGAAKPAAPIGSSSPANASASLLTAPILPADPKWDPGRAACGERGSRRLAMAHDC
nr:hypothetical protein [uncultured Rhodopila sp.]